MQLQISYQDGTTRVVNVISDFFEAEQVRDRYKTIVVSPEQKCMDIALSGGSNPYEIVLREGTTIVHKHVNRGNKPLPKSATPEWVGFMEKDNVTVQEVKELRKVPFTKRWVPGSDGLSFEKGILLMLNHVK